MKLAQLFVAATGCACFSDAFAPSSFSSPKQGVVVDARTQVVADHPFRIQRSMSFKNTATTSLFASSTGNDESPSWQFNPLYGGFLVGFLSYAFLIAGPGQGLTGGELDTSIITAFITDPLHPANVNLLFVQIFNILGVFPMVITSLMVPQSAKKGLPAWPFAITGLAGYPGFAPYLTFRAPPVERKTLAETSWITANILENKIFSWSLIGLLFSIPLTTGFADAIISSTDPNIWGQLLADYAADFQATKIVSASTVDLCILTVTAATLIPRDYQLRVEDPEKAEQGKLIAAATVLLPALGAALYCAFRPSLPEE